jgi:hypothetical protein
MMGEEERWRKVEEIVRRVVSEELDARGMKSKTKLSFSHGRWIGVTEEQLEAWKHAYPGIDVQTQLKLAAAWIVSNPNLAPKSNYARFMNTWLSRQQHQVSIHAIPSMRSIATKTCRYCERPASGSVNGYDHCSTHMQDAMDNVRPMKVA